MRTLRISEDYEGRDTEFTFYNLTDLHLGARACDEKGIRDLVSEIQDNPRARWIGGGDYVDAICHVGDRRYKPSKLAKWLAQVDDVMGAQRNYFCEMVRPIMDKCWGLIQGNHEFAALQWYGRDLYGEICTILAGYANKPPTELALTTHGFVVVKFRRLTGEKKRHSGTDKVTIYAAHGQGGGRLPGTHALALWRILAVYECNLAVVGHRHVSQHISYVRAVPNGKTAKGKQMIGMFCGSMLGALIKPPPGDTIGTDTYGERAGYPPQATGLPWVTFKPNKGKYIIHNSASLDLVDLAYDS